MSDVERLATEALEKAIDSALSEVLNSLMTPAIAATDQENEERCKELFIAAHKSLVKHVGAVEHVLDHLGLSREERIRMREENLLDGWLQSQHHKENDGECGDPSCNFCRDIDGKSAES